MNLQSTVLETVATIEPMNDAYSGVVHVIFSYDGPEQLAQALGVANLDQDALAHSVAIGLGREPTLARCATLTVGMQPVASAVGTIWFVMRLWERPATSRSIFMSTPKARTQARLAFLR